MKIKAMKLSNPFKKLFGGNSASKESTSKSDEVRLITRTINEKQNSELETTKATSLVEAKEQGESYGRQNLPTSDQEHFSPFELKQQAIFNGLAQGAREYVAEPIAKVKATILNLESAIHRANTNEAVIKATINDEAKKLADRDSKLADDSYDEEAAHLKGSIIDRQNQIKVLELQKDKVLIETRPVVGLLIFFGLLSLSVGGESYLQYPCWLYVAREGVLGTSIITFTTAVITALGCHLYAKKLHVFSETGAFGKKLLMLIPPLAYCCIFWMLGGIRKDFILSIDPTARTLEEWEFLIMNIVICAVMVYSSFHYASYDSEAVALRRKLEATIKEHQAELAKLKSQLEQLQAKHKALHAQASSALLSSIGSVHKGSEGLHVELDGLKTQYGELLAFVRTSELNIQDAYREVIQCFRDNNYTFRPTKVMPRYWQKPLNLDLHYQMIDQVETAPFKLNGSLKTLLILLTLRLFSCSQPPAEITKAFLTIDVTDSLTIPSGDGLLQALGFDIEAQRPQRLDIGFTVLSDVSSNRVREISLDLSDGQENKFNRASKGKKFATQLDSVLNGFTQVEKGKYRSCLYRPICALLTELQESDADHKVLIVLSDLLESSDIIQLYSSQYASLPDFNTTKIKAKLQGKIPFPHCDGIDIIVVCQPTVDNDRLILKVQSLYRAMFEEHGAKSITFVTNL